MIKYHITYKHNSLVFLLISLMPIYFAYEFDDIGHFLMGAISMMLFSAILLMMILLSLMIFIVHIKTVNIILISIQMILIIFECIYLCMWFC